MKYRLSDGTVVDGGSWVTINDLQYLLDHMSPEELTALGVTQVQSFDPSFYELVDGLVTQLPLETIKSYLKERVASDRWVHENSGVNFEGFRFPADESTRTVMTAMFMMASLDQNFSVPNFKLPSYVDDSGVTHPSQFIALSNAQILAVGQAILSFIQSCFDRNREINDEIDALVSHEQAASFAWSWD